MQYKLNQNFGGKIAGAVRTTCATSEYHDGVVSLLLQPQNNI